MFLEAVNIHSDGSYFQPKAGFFNQLDFWNTRPYKNFIQKQMQFYHTRLAE